MLSYARAFALAEKKGLKIYSFIRGRAYTNMQGGGHITTRTIDKLCAALDCQPGDLMEYVPDNRTDTPQE